jgi:TonB family protein
MLIRPTEQSAKTIRCIRRLILASITTPLLLSHPASAMRFAAIGFATALHLQESGVGSPLGKLNVSPKVMAGQCITMVSPNYPQTAGDSPAASTVIVRVVIWRSGNVSPMRVISGPSALQDEAMNTVRLWKYKPFARDGELLDVTTDIPVDFDPAKPGGVVTHPTR